MKIELEDISKSFLHHIIFRGVNQTFESGSKWVFTGGNGSGKSTLLRLVSGNLTPSKGRVVYKDERGEISHKSGIKNISLSAPYLDLIEDFTFPELIDFHQKFKPFKNNLSAQEVLAISELSRVSKKRIANFSSGMKQRAKLTLAILSDSPVLLLDEPFSNLDQKGKDWYTHMMTTYTEKNTVIIASNHVKGEYFMAQKTLDIAHFKK